MNNLQASACFSYLKKTYLDVNSAIYANPFIWRFPGKFRHAKTCLIWKEQKIYNRDFLMWCEIKGT